MSKALNVTEIEYKDIHIVVYPSSVRVVECMADVNTIEEAKALIDSEYINYKETCHPDIDGTFTEFINDQLHQH
jgi:hypothetical protein